MLILQPTFRIHLYEAFHQLRSKVVVVVVVVVVGGGNPKRMVQEMDLGKNYYISFSYFLKKILNTKSMPCFSHNRHLYNNIEQNHYFDHFFCFLCTKLNAARNSVLALEERKANLQRAIEKMHLLAAICILECTVISELLSYWKKKPV